MRTSRKRTPMTRPQKPRSRNIFGEDPDIVKAIAARLDAPKKKKQKKKQEPPPLESAASVSSADPVREEAASALADGEV